MICYYEIIFVVALLEMGFEMIMHLYLIILWIDKIQCNIRFNFLQMDYFVLIERLRCNNRRCRNLFKIMVI